MDRGRGKEQLTTNRKLFYLIFATTISFEILIAIPRFAIKEGSCNTCHVNPTGGALRNDYANLVISPDEIAMPKTASLVQLSDPGQLTDHLRIGADLRAQFISDSEEASFFPMQADFYAHYDVAGFAGIYVESEALLGTTEYWSNVFLPFLNSFVKVGKLRPYYGLGLDDHTSFIRGGNIKRTKGLVKEGLPFSPMRPPINGAEIGFFGMNYSVTGSISNGFLSGESAEAAFLGPPGNRTVVLRGERSISRGEIDGFVGASYLSEGETLLRGIFGGVARGPLLWMGEVDLMTGWSGNVTGMASYSEFAWIVRQGVHLLAKYDFIDEDIEVLENALSRFSLGVELYPFSFLEFKLQIRKTTVAGGGTSPAEFLFQTHAWF
mgnify:CR=1 FL=1